jgi:hypothetical protein
MEFDGAVFTAWGRGCRYTGHSRFCNVDTTFSIELKVLICRANIFFLRVLYGRLIGRHVGWQTGKGKVNQPSQRSYAACECQSHLLVLGNIMLRRFYLFYYN